MEIFCPKDLEELLNPFLDDVDEEVVFHQPFPEEQNNGNQQDQYSFSQYFELVYRDLFVNDVLDEDGLSEYLANGFVDGDYKTSYDFQNRTDREMLFIVLGFLFDTPNGSVDHFVQMHQNFLFGEKNRNFQCYMNEQYPSEKTLTRFRYFLQENHQMVQDVLQFGFAKQVAQKICAANWNSPDVNVEKVRKFKENALNRMSAENLMLTVCVEMNHFPRTMVLYVPSISPFGFIAEPQQQIRMSLVNRITIKQFRSLQSGHGGNNSLLYESNS